MSLLCIDMHASNHETLQQTQSHQYAPLQQHVQDPLQEEHESTPQQWNPNGFDAVLDNGERREMYDGPDGGPSTTEQGHKQYTP